MLKLLRKVVGNVKYWANKLYYVVNKGNAWAEFAEECGVSDEESFDYDHQNGHGNENVSEYSYDEA